MMNEKYETKNILEKVKQIAPRMNQTTVRVLVRFLIHIILLMGIVLVLVQAPENAHASVESTLISLKSKLTGFILPVLSVIGLAVAGMSFMMGSENAKKHLAYAAIGCALGFGAQAIVDFISSTVV